MIKTIVIGLMFLSFSLNAQNYKLGKVTVDELKEKVHPLDSTASAAILFTRGRTYFDYKPDDGFSIVTEVEVKIKVYKKDGYSWANKEVSFFIGETEEETVVFNKAITYNLVNGEIEKSKLKNDAEFTEKVNKFWSKRKITMPNVKEGSVIEYSYTMKSPFYTSLVDWDFQKSIPVNYSEYQTLIPEYFVYNSQKKGNLVINVGEKSSDKQYSGSVNEKVNGVGGYQMQKRDYNLAFKEKSTIYSSKDVKALKDEEYINNIENYTGSIVFELSSVQFPNEAFKNYATDWETVVKNIYENEDFGNQLVKTNYFEEDLAIITAGMTSNTEKLIAIFNFVKNRMAWNGFNSYNCNDGVKIAYKNKVGNVAEINLILIAMLRNVGIEVNPIILSTRSNGIKIFPSRTAFNYVIAGVELENQIVLLDATDKNAVANILPKRALNWIGRIIRKDGSSALIDLSPKMISKESHTVMAELNNQGVFSGKVRQQYFDYNAYEYRNNYLGLTNESNVDRIEKRFPGMEVSELEIQNERDFTKPILEGFTFTNNNSVEIIGNKMYFSPLLFFTMNENPFKQEVREYPIDFTFPNQERFTINIKIPDGYAIENLPKQTVIEMPDSIMGFKYNVSTTGQQIQVLAVFDINQSIISHENYAALKNFFKEVINKETEKIVIAKI